MSIFAGYAQLMNLITLIQERAKEDSSAEESNSYEQLSYSRLCKEIDDQEQSQEIRTHAHSKTLLGFPQVRPLPKPLVTLPASQQVELNKDGPSITIRYSHYPSPATPSSNQPEDRLQYVHSLPLPLRGVNNKFQPTLSSIKEKEDEQGSSQKSMLASQIVSRVIIQSLNRPATKPQPNASLQSPKSDASNSPMEQDKVLIRAVEDSVEYQMEQNSQQHHLSEHLTISRFPGEPAAILSSLTTLSKKKYKQEERGERQQSQAVREEQNLQIFSKLQNIAALVKNQYELNKKQIRHSAALLSRKQEQAIAEMTARMAQLESRQKSSISQQQLQESPPHVTHSLPRGPRFKFSPSPHETSFNQPLPRAAHKFSQRSEGSSELPQLDIPSLTAILDHEIWGAISRFDGFSVGEKQEVIIRILQLVMKESSQVRIVVEKEETIAICLRNCKLIAIATPAHFYFGEFTNIGSSYLRQGYGVLVRPSVQVYAGSFKANYRHGRAICLSHTETYRGQYAHNFKQGRGITHYTRGDLYQGEYSNDQFHGRGCFKWKNGASYEGYFKWGKMEGTGHWKSFSGDHYLGGYKDSLKQGWGVYTYADGRAVEGYFHKGKRTKRREQPRREQPRREQQRREQQRREQQRREQQRREQQRREQQRREQSCLEHQIYKQQLPYRPNRERLPYRGQLPYLEKQGKQSRVDMRSPETVAKLRRARSSKEVQTIESIEFSLRKRSSREFSPSIEKFRIRFN